VQRAAPSIDALVAEELRAPAGAAGDAARALVDAILARHGAAVAAVLLYGSCLRRRSAEGVLDFYVLVDDYRRAWPTRRAAWLNARLPPSVVWCEVERGGERLHAKYALMSTPDFARLAAGRGLDGRVWARFSQPAALVFARDPAARAAVEAAVAGAVVTMLDRLRCFLPGAERVQRFRADELWRTALRETYRAELRSERPEAVAGLVAAAPERYDRAARAALRWLAAAGRLAVVAEEADGVLCVASDPRERARARRAWRVRRPLGKALAVAGLFKTALTFGDWVPYVLWKLERHSGQRIEVSERQRRHPLLFGWPVVVRLLRRGVLR
jgi:hypothetical protein